MLAGVEDASAAFRWPWQQQPHHRRGGPRPNTQTTPPVDCAQILAAVRSMSQVELERSLRLLSKARREQVDRCVGAGQ
jgi:hypothetical protein